MIKSGRGDFPFAQDIFLKGNIIFILITGKAFYYDWLNKRTTEDDIFFSLFTRVIHIPLFSEEELSHRQAAFPGFSADLLTHLKYKAKGTPREFMRELSVFWNGRQNSLPSECRMQTNDCSIFPAGFTRIFTIFMNLSIKTPALTQASRITCGAACTTGWSG